MTQRDGFECLPSGREGIGCPQDWCVKKKKKERTVLSLPLCSLCSMMDCLRPGGKPREAHERARAQRQRQQAAQRKREEPYRVNRPPFPGIPVDPASVGLEHLAHQEFPAPPPREERPRIGPKAPMADIPVPVAPQFEQRLLFKAPGFPPTMVTARADSRASASQCSSRRSPSCDPGPQFLAA
eukprot:TRINITY_DN15657_c0_g1_i1.p1 TRINITY_DN15657_c0_g1~~TRINITY_DN15657_c0_g1_i1.p1  ORF type:complete len:183 (+),score=20.55 TRINITY_DN15657_c0_g1_i1:94-642(+)